MSKKKEAIIVAERKNFVYGDEKLGIDGCIKRGISEQVANKIYDDMSDFAKYAFNKSHAACYAAISMQTAYLKAHYPVEFFAGLLTSVADQTKKLTKYILECKKSGLVIMNPDINNSEVNFTATLDGTVIYGLSAIKSVGKNVQHIIADRNENGPFAGLGDLVRRIPSINKSVLESLANAGAMDFFGYHRSTLLANIENTQKAAKKDIKFKEAQCDGQLNFFEIEQYSLSEDKEIMAADNFVEVDELAKRTILENEKSSTGFYISGHPFEEYQILLENAKERNSSLEYLNSTYFMYEEEDENVEVDEGELLLTGTDGINVPQSNDRELLVEEDQKVAIAGIITNFKGFRRRKPVN